jgi:transcriptional regulator with XRE-family HTH domain
MKIQQVNSQDVLRNISHKRKQLNLSIEQMAIALHISATTYKRIEQGHVGITLDRLIHIVNLLNIRFKKMLFN